MTVTMSFFFFFLIGVRVLNTVLMLVQQILYQVFLLVVCFESRCPILGFLLTLMSSLAGTAKTAGPEQSGAEEVCNKSEGCGCVSCTLRMLVVERIGTENIYTTLHKTIQNQNSGQFKNSIIG